LLNLPLAPVIPAHLCPVPGPLYTVLMGYKESPVAEARRRFTGLLEDLCRAFLAAHRACVVTAIGGPVDLVLPVPSSSRPGRASLERVEGLPALVGATFGATFGATASYVPRVLERAGGGIGHMRPNAGAFSVPPAWRGVVRGARVLLLDDTYVSGSRAQSAAAALRLAGARAALIAPVGRVLRPDRSAVHAAFLDAHPTGAGHWARCQAGQAGTGRE
jgi:hypothetical protein